MPIKGTEEIVNASAVPEFRKIKIGEKGANAPKKWKAPAVTMPMKHDAGSKFNVDEAIMASIRIAQNKAKDSDIDGVPVRLLTDNIDEAVYKYRAMYNARGRAMCKSNYGDSKAKRFFQKEPVPENKGTKVGNLYILNEPIEIECTPACEFWLPYGSKERAKCQWHAIANTQLEHAPRFPNPARYRTSGPMVIKAMQASLLKIAAVTMDVLANIPLTLTEVEIETVNGAGEKRRHPVMIFVWNGTLSALREAAIVELTSRARLVAAKQGRPLDSSVALNSDDLVGKMTGGALPTMTGDMVGEDSVTDDPDDFVDFDGDKVEVVSAPRGDATPASSEELKAADALREEIQALRVKAGISDRGLQALEDKHHGDQVKIRDELFKLAGPAPAVASAVTVTATVTQAQAPAAKPVDVLDSDFDMGEESEEASDVAEREAEDKARDDREKMEREAAAKVEPEIKGKKPAAAEVNTTSSDFSDFTVFDD